MENGVVKSACKMCRRACGIDIYLQDGMVVEVKGTKENPSSLGILCPKGQAIAEYVNSPNRLKYPLKKEGNSWRRIEWDEAIETIITKLNRLKDQYKARSFGVYIGESANQSQAILYARRFLDVYGSPNLFSSGSLCFRPIPIACQLTFGRLLVPEPENSKCIVLWGVDPYSSNFPMATRIRAAKRTGAKLIVIDPRKTFFARRADIYIQPRPGSDCILALGMLNFIISEGLYSKDFVSDWCTGFEKLKDQITAYTKDKVVKTTGVPWDTIEAAAKIFATTKPACIVTGSSLNHQTCAVQNLRAICILQAITGNVEAPGSWIAPVQLPLSAMSVPEKLNESPLGKEKYPLFVSSGNRLEGQAAVLSDTMLTDKPYPIRAMVIAGGNPVLSWPDTTKVSEALKKLDFLVVMDVAMTKTAELAHLVLPAATFIETTELQTYAESGFPYAILRKKAMEVPECWPDWKFWLQLAKRIGYNEYFPWSDEEECLEFLLKPSGISLNELREKPEGMFYSARQYKTYVQKGFRTSSGKVELYSSELEKLGHNPLPDSRWPEDTKLSKSREYPLILITGARNVEYTHSQFRDITSLRKRVPEPLAEIHPETAGRHGIANNHMICIETEKGKIKLKAKVTEDIMSGVVSIPLGWEEANTNVLTDWKNPDPISGLPVLVNLSCRINPE